MKLVSLNRQEVISDNVIIADSFIKKLFGLTVRKLKNNECFLIPNCNSIHTIGMTNNIGVVFLDKDYRVIKVINSLKPFSFTPFIKKAKNVLEFKVNNMDQKNIEVGDRLKLI